MLIYPAEIEANLVLPTIRKEFCKAAVALGAKQKDIAKLLGITEAAASQYLKGKRGADLKFDADFRQKIKDIVKSVLNGKTGGFEAVQTLSTEFRLSGRLCSLHHKTGGIEPKTCGLVNVCLK